MNKAILVGRLTKDVELRTTPSGVSTCTFTVAVNRRFKNSEGSYDADFINCVAWRQSAEFAAKYFKRGDWIGVSGSIQTRNYEKDGHKVYVTEINAEEIDFVSNKNNSSAPAENFDMTGFEPIPDDDTDLPF